MIETIISNVVNNFDFENVLIVIAVLIAGFIAMGGRSIKPKLVGPPKPPPEKRSFTVDELKKHNGKWGRDAFLGCKGIVYHVDPVHYGPGAAYSVFSGKDISRHLGKMTVNDSEANQQWTDLNEKETKILNDWEAMFKRKYEIRGWLTAPFVPDITKEELDNIPVPQKGGEDPISFFDKKKESESENKKND